MGQRSQIYIRILDENNSITLFAKYFGWNYGERMISRARYGIEYLKDSLKYLALDSTRARINRYFDFNFDMKDVLLSSDILEELREEYWGDREFNNRYIFLEQANNDGKLFIDCNQKSGEIKYCFTDYDLNILSPLEYLKWDMNSSLESFKKDNTEEYNICKKNIEYLSKNAKLMTFDELKNFINQDYSKQIGDSNFKTFLKEFVEKGMNYNTYWQFKIEKIDNKGSWKFYETESKNIMMKYDNVTKKLEIKDWFNSKFYKGLIQDVNDYYGLEYGKKNKEKYENNKENLPEKLDKDKDEISYDF